MRELLTRAGDAMLARFLPNSKAAAADVCNCGCYGPLLNGNRCYYQCEFCFSGNPCTKPC